MVTMRQQTLVPQCVKRWQLCYRMTMVFTICQGMYESGLKIGMEDTQQVPMPQTRLAHLVVQSVHEGGDWDDGPEALRSAKRRSMGPSVRARSIGFRLTRNP